MYSSALKPLTSAAILVSKFVVSKRVILPTPETPSTMFDQTVSMSFPIGVMKPMPVTATRRPLDFDSSVISPAYGREVPTAPSPGGKTCMSLWTRSPKSISEQLLEVERELEPQAVGRDIEVAPEQLFQLLQAVQDRVPMQAKGGRGVLDGAFGQVRLQRLQKLFAVADLGIHQRAKAVGDESLGEERVLGQDEVGDDLIVAVDDRLGPELAPCFESLLGLQVGARDAMQAGMVTPDAGPHPSDLARPLRHLLLQVAD